MSKSSKDRIHCSRGRIEPSKKEYGLPEKEFRKYAEKYAQCFANYICKHIEDFATLNEELQKENDLQIELFRVLEKKVAFLMTILSAILVACVPILRILSQEHPKVFPLAIQLITTNVMMLLPLLAAIYFFQSLRTYSGAMSATEIKDAMDKKDPPEDALQRQRVCSMCYAQLMNKHNAKRVRDILEGLIQGFFFSLVTTLIYIGIAVEIGPAAG